MKHISDIDTNFKIETSIEKDDIRFYNARREPFGIYGIFYEDGKFRRLPEAVAKTVSEGVHFLHANTAGGRLRFKTNSPYVAISAKMENVGKMSHFALCGSAGFDLYVNGAYCMTFKPPFDMENGYESVLELGTCEMKDIMIHFPLYSVVTDLYVGLQENAAVLAPTPYEIEKPIVFYGSSITQGGCASRPGTAYQGFVSRELDADFINLGFSGSARGEREISDYIKGLDMSAFVMDYDYNTPSSAHLEKTHEAMFLNVREAHPTLPILILSCPKPVLPAWALERRAIIEKTYENALARGDKNVAFLDGPALMAYCGTEGTVDGTHPTDFGFFSMAHAISLVLRRMLK